MRDWSTVFQLIQYHSVLLRHINSKGSLTDMTRSQILRGWKFQQSRLGSYIPLTLLILSMLSNPLVAVAAEKENRKKNHTEQLETLRGEIKKIQRGQSQNRDQQKKLNHQLQRLETEINDLGTVMADLQRTHRAEQTQINQLEKRLTEQQRLLGKHKQLLGYVVRRAYLNGQQEYVKLLLNQQNPADIQRMLSYYGYFQQAQVTEIADLDITIAKLQVTQNQLTKTRRSAANSLEKISQQQAALTTRRGEQTSLLARLVDDYEDNESQLEKMRQDEARLAELVQRLQQALTDIPDSAGQPFSSVRGALRWPAKGRIKHRFGQRKQNTGMRWQGVLINTPGSSSVHAVHAGQVVFADWLRGFGLLIIIDHGDDYMTIYGHNQSLQRDSGGWVKQGEVIATAGTGSGETESGLYFEIRHRGKPTNPEKWCRGG